MMNKVSTNCGLTGIMHTIRITIRPLSKIRKWNQLSQFRWTSTEVVLIEKTEAGCYISTMRDQLSCISVFVAYLTIPSSN